MKAIGYQQCLPISDDMSLVDITLPEPVATGRDILVQVKAVAVNPVDTKIRKSTPAPENEWKVLGYDAAGVVVGVGESVEHFAVGDEVYYAGSIARAGTNAEKHLVDERIASRKPKNLSFAEAAALPLTTLTAWEILFHRMDIQRPVAGAANTILIIGGAGGVGSIAIQLVKQLTDLHVIATASREETKAWVKQLGADTVLDHSKSLAMQIAELKLDAPAFVFSTTHTPKHFSDIVELIAPQGRFGLIDETQGCDIDALKRKSISLHWEFMFTRALFSTHDMSEQSILLEKVAELIEQNAMKTTLTETYTPINAENLKKAHALIESGKAKGKIVLEAF